MKLILRRIAARIADETASQRDLSVDLRECLHHGINKKPGIINLFPSGYFEDKMYDTSDLGKGIRAGYVSFGLRPDVFNTKELIGGILIRGTYDPSVIKSDAPDAEDPAHKEWVTKGGNPELKASPVEVIDLEACYYNKRGGGGAKREGEGEREGEGQLPGKAPPVEAIAEDVIISEGGIYSNTCCSLGEALFQVDKFEKVIDCDLSDPNKVKSCIEGIVNGIIKNPPEGAKRKKTTRRVDHYESPRSFINYLGDEGRNTYTADEIRMIAQRRDRVPSEIERMVKNEGRAIGVQRDPTSAFPWMV